MSKKHFISLAAMIRNIEHFEPEHKFSQGQIEALADWCRLQNRNFNRERWLGYIAGECGPNGGEVKNAGSR